MLKLIATAAPLVLAAALPAHAQTALTRDTARTIIADRVEQVYWAEYVAVRQDSGDSCTSLFVLTAPATNIGGVFKPARSVTYRWNWATPYAMPSFDAARVEVVIPQGQYSNLTIQAWNFGNSAAEARRFYEAADFLVRSCAPAFAAAHATPAPTAPVAPAPIAAQPAAATRVAADPAQTPVAAQTPAPAQTPSSAPKPAMMRVATEGSPLLPLNQDVEITPAMASRIRTSTGGDYIVYLGVSGGSQFRVVWRAADPTIVSPPPDDYVDASDGAGIANLSGSMTFTFVEGGEHFIGIQQSGTAALPSGGNAPRAFTPVTINVTRVR